MDHAAGVGVGEPSEDVVDHRPEDRPRQPRRVHPLVHAAPGEDVHREEGTPVVELPEVAGPHDGRVVEQRDGARLLAEPPALLGAASLLLRRAQALEGHLIARDDVPAQVHHAHAAAAELALDLVALGEDRADLARPAARGLLRPAVVVMAGKSELASRASVSSDA